MPKKKLLPVDHKPDRATKARVNDYGRESFCTPTAKAKLLRQVRDEGIPDAFSKDTHRRKRHQEVAHCIQDVEFDSADGSTERIPMQRPDQVLQHAVRISPHFATLLQTAIEDAGATPLELVLYYDEVEPSDPLKKGDRKILAIYWSFANFGADALSNDDCWFTLGVIRTTPLADSLLDGYCQIMCKTLDIFFRGDASFSDGLTLEFPRACGAVITLFLVASFDVFVSDEKAIKQLSGVKGASGRKLCLFCVNIKGWRFFKPDPGGFYLASNSLAPDEFKEHTDASLRDVYRKVLAARATMIDASGGPSGAFKEYEREMGVSVNERYHPLLREEFKPISSIVFDPQHVYLCGGVFDGECQAFFEHLEEDNSGLGFAAFDAYATEWVWPKGYANGKSCAKKGRWNGTASEYLSVAPVLAKWVNDVVKQAGVCPAECDSMLELCKTVELLELGMQGYGDPDDLDTQILNHSTAQQVSYGSDLWKAKNHHAFHLPGFLRRFRRLFNCFTLERKHKVPKRFSVTRVNTTAYERGILEEVLDQHFWELKKPILKHMLMDLRDAPKRMHDAVVSELNLLPGTAVQTASKARVKSRAVRVGDVVLMSDNTIAEVWFFAGVGDLYFACLSTWPTTRVISDTCVITQIVDNPRLLPLSEVLASCIYRRTVAPPMRMATVLLPRH
jgi:hypothetical protein